MNGCAGGFAAAPQSGAFQNCNGNFEIAHSINGLTGTVLNVYTAPQYRRKGISSKLIENLLAFAKERKLDFVELKATVDGYSVYKKAGFKEHCSAYTEMRFEI